MITFIPLVQFLDIPLLNPPNYFFFFVVVLFYLLLFVLFFSSCLICASLYTLGCLTTTGEFQPTNFKIIPTFSTTSQHLSANNNSLVVVWLHPHILSNCWNFIGFEFANVLCVLSKFLWTKLYKNYTEIKLLLTQKLQRYWLAFIVLEGVVHTTRGEKQPSILSQLWMVRPLMVTNIMITILQVQSHCVYNLLHMLKHYLTWQIMRVMNLRIDRSAPFRDNQLLLFY